MAIRYAAQQEGEDALIAEINTTPLVDVMLVLLIIFLITIPVVTSSIAVNLPREQNLKRDAQQENVIVTVDAQGTTYWFNTPLPDRAALEARLRDAAAQPEQPEVHVRADRKARYEPVAAVLTSAQRAGLVKIGLVGTEQFAQ